MPIADLARDVRENVIDAVERISGLEVVEVNITVNDVHLPDDEDPERPVEARAWSDGRIRCPAVQQRMEFFIAVFANACSPPEHFSDRINALSAATAPSYSSLKSSSVRTR